MPKIATDVAINTVLQSVSVLIMSVWLQYPDKNDTGENSKAKMNERPDRE